MPDESGATVALPVWPESRYLARMAKLAPEKVTSWRKNASPVSNQKSRTRFSIGFRKGRMSSSTKLDGRNSTAPPPTDEKITGYSKRWQRDRLAPLSAGLPEDWKQRYEQLVAEFGPVEEPQTVSNPTWGWSSPKTQEELGALPIDQLVDYLKSWAPSAPGNPFGDSIEGLARAVGALVVSEPERFSGEAEQFKGLDPTYVRTLLQALWESARQRSLCRCVEDLCCLLRTIR